MCKPGSFRWADATPGDKKELAGDAENYSASEKRTSKQRRVLDDACGKMPAVIITRQHQCNEF